MNYSMNFIGGRGLGSHAAQASRFSWLQINKLKSCFYLYNKTKNMYLSREKGVLKGSVFLSEKDVIMSSFVFSPCVKSILLPLLKSIFKEDFSSSEKRDRHVPPCLFLARHEPDTLHSTPRHDLETRLCCSQILLLYKLQTAFLGLNGCFVMAIFSGATAWRQRLKSRLLGGSLIH